MENLKIFKIVIFALLVVIIGCSHSTKKVEDRKDSKDAQFYFNQGFDYQDHGMLDEAILDYNKAIEMDPVFADAYFNRGNAYKDKGHLDQAISDYSKAIEINSEDAAAYNNRGIALIEKKEVTRGCTDIKHSYKLENCQLYESLKSKGICQLYEFLKSKGICK